MFPKPTTRLDAVVLHDMCLIRHPLIKATRTTPMDVATLQPCTQIDPGILIPYALVAMLRVVRYSTSHTFIVGQRPTMTTSARLKSGAINQAILPRIFDIDEMTSIAMCLKPPTIQGSSNDSS